MNEGLTISFRVYGMDVGIKGMSVRDEDEIPVVMLNLELYGEVKVDEFIDFLKKLSKVDITRYEQEWDVVMRLVKETELDWYKAFNKAFKADELNERGEEDGVQGDESS
jgi:ABC-type multidrug transport system ATPase subunit